MSVLSDAQIESLCFGPGRPMIEPFEAQQVRERIAADGVTEKIISYGLSSYGYDARIADDFRIFTNVDNAVVDPKAFSGAAGCLTSYADRNGKYQGQQGVTLPKV